MRDFLYAFRASGLFIGTVIGAGFATGEEIRLYFMGESDLTVVLSAIFFGLLCTLFLSVGRKAPVKLPPLLNKSKDATSFLVVGISLVAMCSAAEKIVFDAFSLYGGGMATFFLCLMLAKRDNKMIAGVNAFLVPVIIVFTVAIYLACDTARIDIGGANAMPAFLYASMNIFSAGIMLEECGRDMTKRQIKLSAFLTTAIMLALMLCIKKTVEKTGDSMPMLSMANEVGLGVVCSIGVYLAVFTTMLSDVKIMLGGDKSYARGLLRVGILCAIAFFGSAVCFSDVVREAYPVIGYCGVVSTAYATLRLFGGGLLFKKSNERIHSSC